jgi:hypothetical protein
VAVLLVLVWVVEAGADATNVSEGVFGNLPLALVFAFEIVSAGSYNCGCGYIWRCGCGCPCLDGLLGSRYAGECLGEGRRDGVHVHACVWLPCW